MALYSRRLIVAALITAAALHGVTASGQGVGFAVPADMDALDRPTRAEAATRRLLGMAFNAIRVKDYGSAEKLLLRALRIEPRNPYVLLNLGVVFYQTDRPKLARDMWTRVANAPIATLSNSVITSSPDLVGESPANIARKNLELFTP
jgi:tetratricopeptide (TPR) repeat protein